MRNDDLKSPCRECILHARGLDKRDPRLPCGSCASRLAYAAAVFDPMCMVIDHNMIYDLPVIIPNAVRDFIDR